MEDFCNCLCILSWTNLWSDPSNKLDFIFYLPPEIACTILRKLDDKSLFSSAFVSRYWLKICKSDPVLKERIKQILKIHQEEEQVKENQSPESVYSSIRKIVNKFNSKQKSLKAVKNIKKIFTNSKKRKRCEIIEEPPSKCIRI